MSATPLLQRVQDVADLWRSEEGATDIAALLDEVVVAVKAQAAEVDALKQTLHDEIDGNLRLRAMGRARPDETMTAFLERVIRERDAALAQPAAPADVERDAARYRWLRTWVKRDVDTQAVVPMTGTFQATALSLDELDAAIDTAMLAAAPEVKP